MTPAALLGVLAASRGGVVGRAVQAGSVVGLAVPTQAAMAELDDLVRLLEDYHLYHASRAELLRELGHPGQARAVDRRTLELTSRRRTSQPDHVAVVQDSDLAYNYDHEDDELGSRQDTVLRPGGRSGSDS